MFDALGGTPLTSWPHLRATLMPLSTASAPLFMGSTMSLPHSAASAAQVAGTAQHELEAYSAGQERAFKDAQVSTAAAIDGSPGLPPPA